ncbi:DUF4252 domain-containing protein [Haliscomenobacter hydrossis]|uniref:DUF4252 domain-containing protein n=1 Tax=Haliscomenobacter hydrossis (strain ATCC 27775 / DSM 1100 / LMG 10767 / O) TaxID=760192 RepID=F4KP62_HALH1|nr:DUF4252 domain-containing protein [Haliscomenobacter hydrossis]AEE48856.1 hypothetical protein Halhy_0955 [Haliscomenobacter hydrossis DSM 1100]
MKKIIFCLALLGLGCALPAQNQVVRDFMHKFGRHEQATHLNIGGLFLKIAAKNSDDDEANRIMRSISSLHLLNFDENNPVEAQDISKLMQQLHDDKFEDLAYFKDGDSHIRFLVKEERDVITDVIMVIRGENNFLLLNLEGRLRYSDLNDLNMEVNGSKEFKRLPEDRKTLPKKA